MCICIYDVCMRACMYVLCMYLCMHVCIYIYTLFMNVYVCMYVRLKACTQMVFFQELAEEAQELGQRPVLQLLRGNRDRRETRGCGGCLGFRIYLGFMDEGLGFRV